MTKSFALVVGLLWMLAPQQQQQTATSQVASATGVISGALTSADQGVPIRKAQVRLTSASPRIVRTTTTDVDGRYEFTGLAPGAYVLSASRPGYLEMVLGARRPGPTSQGTIVQLAAGQKLEKISWTLPRAGVIAGTVLDEYGDPAFNVPVRAFRYGFQNAHRVLESGGTATTDDRGMYRIANLPPGEYLVSAVPRDTVAQAAAQHEMINARRAEAIAAASAANRSSNVGPAPPMPSSTGYVPVYYPGTPLGSAAQTVRIGISEEISSIDIRLQFLQTASISGRVTSAEGALPTTRLQLIDTSLPLNIVGVQFRDMRPDGSFAFHGLVPGNYLLQGFGTPGGPQGAAGGQMWGAANLAVDPRGIDDVVLAMRRGITISGRLMLEGLPAGVDRAQVRASLVPVMSPIDWELPTVALSPSVGGAFSARNVLPGTYRVNVTGLPPGWTIASAAFGDRDAADHHLRVDGSTNLTGTIALTSKTATLSGAVVDAGGAAASDRTVLLFPTDGALWLPYSRRILIAQPAPDGRYEFHGLPPGDYRLVALLDPEPGRQFDPEFLASLVGFSTPVSLGEGETRTIDLKAR